MCRVKDTLRRLVDNLHPLLCYKKCVFALSKLSRLNRVRFYPVNIAILHVALQVMHFQFFFHNNPQMLVRASSDTSCLFLRSLESALFNLCNFQHSQGF